MRGRGFGGVGDLIRKRPVCFRQVFFCYSAGIIIVHINPILLRVSALSSTNLISCINIPSVVPDVPFFWMKLSTDVIMEIRRSRSLASPRGKERTNRSVQSRKIFIYCCISTALGMT
jgi:hypothetical protein